MIYMIHWGSRICSCNVQNLCYVYDWLSPFYINWTQLECHTLKVVYLKDMLHGTVRIQYLQDVINALEPTKCKSSFQDEKNNSW